jgi:hypothetical protein
MTFSREEFHPVFRRVVAELVLPLGALPPLFEAIYGFLDDGKSRQLKALAGAWPPGADWPSGRTWLQAKMRRELEAEAEDEGEDAEWQPGDPLPEVPERNLHELLLMRVSRLASRAYRDAQIRESYRHERWWTLYPTIAINRHLDVPCTPCGRGRDERVPAEEGLRLMEQKCEHPVCECRFDPVRIPIGSINS